MLVGALLFGGGDPVAYGWGAAVLVAVAPCDMIALLRLLLLL